MPILILMKEREVLSVRLAMESVVKLTGTVKHSPGSASPEISDLVPELSGSGMFCPYLSLSAHTLLDLTFW